MQVITSLLQSQLCGQRVLLVKHTALACAAFSSGEAFASNWKVGAPAFLLSSTRTFSASAAVTLLFGSLASSSATCCFASALEWWNIAPTAHYAPNVIDADTQNMQGLKLSMVSLGRTEGNITEGTKQEGKDARLGQEVFEQLQIHLQKVQPATCSLECLASREMELK